MENVLHVYCDESRQTIDRYMVLGALVIEPVHIPVFTSTITKFRTEENVFSELKWSKVGDKRLGCYKKYVDYFFALNNSDNVHFHSMIVDTHQLNHKKYSFGDKELGFYKFFYQLLLHCVGGRYTDYRYVVHFDKRQSRYPLSQLKGVLNNGMRKSYPKSNSVFVATEPKDSSDSDLIQLADILMGAVGYQKNAYDLLGNAKQSKIDLARHIADRAGMKRLGEYSTARRIHRFTNWNFRLRPRI